MDISNISFNVAPNGNKVGDLFFPNSYGLTILETNGSLTYDVSFLQKVSDGAWLTEMDGNMRTITEINHLKDVTEEQVNTYILQVENLPNK
jgi:hypothetical protein